MEREDEALLVRRVATGDRAAFALLVRQHQKPLSAYAQRMLSDVDSANDIVQETFLRLWTRAGSYNSSTARLTTWLHNIAHNLCVDSFRRQARISYSDNDDLEIPVCGPGDSYQHAQKAAQVRAALQVLPERQRSALLLCHYQGLSNRDAAAVLDVSVDALESLLARARRRLKEELQIDDES